MNFADIAAVNGTLPKQKQEEKAADEDNDKDLDAMQARLAALQ